MEIQFDGIRTKEELKKHVIEHGCFSPEENAETFDFWFNRPRDVLFRRVFEEYGLRDKTVADAGCAYGPNLVYCKPGSYGIEIGRKGYDFARAVGLQVYNRDIINDDLSDLPKVDAVWSSQTAEHLDSPHIFFRKLHGLLRPNGLLLLTTPLISRFDWMPRLPKVGKLFARHLHDDHVNAWTPRTLRHQSEYAGFRVKRVQPFHHNLLHRPDITKHFPFRWMANCALLVGEKVEGWDYGSHSYRRADESARGYAAGVPLHEGSKHSVHYR